MNSHMPAHRRQRDVSPVHARPAAIVVGLVAAGLAASQAVQASAASVVAPRVATVVLTHQAAPSTMLTSNVIETDGQQLLLAYLASDSAENGSGGSFDAVTGCGLTWSKVVEANHEAGPTAIWSTLAQTSLSGCRVSAHRDFGSWSGSIYVVGYTGTSGIGARAAASGTGEAAAVSLRTTGEQSLVAGVAVDWDRAVSRQPVPGQHVVAQDLTRVHDTYWLQTPQDPIATPTTVTLADTATTQDRFNFAAVEILARTGIPTAEAASATQASTVPVHSTTQPSTVSTAPITSSTSIDKPPSTATSYSPLVVGSPDNSNTGVPAGTTLTASDSLSIDTPGALVEGMDVAGTVSINASNVTFRRSRVTGSAFSIIRVKDGVTGVRIEDVIINGQGLSGTSNSMGVMGPATVLRADISGVENGVVPSSGSLIQDSWIHNLAAPGEPHIDGIQMDGGLSNIRVLHNTIDMSEWDQTAAVMIDNFFGPISNIQVDRNRLLGGGYTVYADGQFSGGSITGVSFTNNHIARGYFGNALIRATTADPVWFGNVVDGTTAPANP